ncbi:MAG: hypothetical protein JWO90_476 [Solirubrobacterales bacterium]|jgi:hypothetical protein|nr:hypothetical protein [Solirubrobacterales bacterium]
MMLGALVASALLGLLAVRTRRAFAWDDPMCALMLVTAGLMVVMCASLLLDGRWVAALFTAPMAAAMAVPAILLGRVRPRATRPPEEPEDDDGPGGGGPPEDPGPGPQEPAIDWERFDTARAAWGRRSGSRHDA